MTKLPLSLCSLITCFLASLPADAEAITPIQVLKNTAEVPLGIVVNADATLNVKHGTVERTENGEITFTPAPGFFGKTVIHAKDQDDAMEIPIDVRKHPNFVFILTDDQSWTSLSARMDKDDPASASDYHRTPHIDSLATEGMRFSRGYSPAPNCSPTRYANLTGKTCARLKFTDIVGRGHTKQSIGRKLVPINKATRAIRTEDITIPELLKTLPDADYATAHFGKWHLGGGKPEDHGFDASDGPTGNREGSQGPVVKEDAKLAYGIANRGNQFIANTSAQGRPFYCQLSHYAVHAKIQYRADTFEQTAAAKPGNTHASREYAAMIADLDASVGLMLAKLDEFGLRQSTYVIYQADNGAPKFMSNAYPLKRYKPEIWEGGNRVPTLVRGPSIPANSQSNAPMMGIDLLPTLWELAGGQKNNLPADLDGASIVPRLLKNPEAPINRPGQLVLHSPHYVLTKDLTKNQRPSSALHEGPWKILAWYETGDIHLFNLADDPGETTDLARNHPEEKLRLWKTLRDYLAEVDAQLPTLDPTHSDNPGTKDDADADGLPDAWEFRQLLTHALGPDDDPDEDGKTNRSEFEAHSDPLSADQ